VSFKLKQDEVVDDKPSLLPPPGLRGAGEEVATDLRTLVSGSHLSQNWRQTHLLVAFQRVLLTLTGRTPYMSHTLWYN